MKKIVKILIIAIILIILFAIAIYMITSNKKENNVLEKKDEIVNDLFSKQLELAYNVGHRIDNIKIIDLENAKELYPESTSDAIFAFVEYSIKDPTELAGNGRPEGEWTVEKSACVYIDKVNGEYKFISAGTGW